ncbi:protein ZNF365 [Anguilla anguilla]|uniref:protein ZNF365 n=1 Tax=Anguilla anguilla TaxID=7936 RepID=UPI0015A9A21A|nr:protein ZNF365 [Anguilla anguilla]XP_035255512.1 protein ZNF365 [Anguilla anguilla]
MQQRLSVRNLPPCREIRELPFRCPRCGERERFRSLSSLRAHLDYSHAYHTLHDLGPGSRWRPADAAPLPDGRRAREGRCTERCKSAETRRPGDDNDGGGNATATTGKGRSKHGEVTVKEVQGEEQGEEKEKEEGGGAPEGAAAVAVVAVGAEPAGAELAGAEPPGAEPGARLRRRLQDMLRATDGTAERRLLSVSTELARADSELLRHRARSQHLAQVKQELCQRERALTRQVDSAVMVIATLRQQLCASQQELERKEQEVITIHHFLETAVQHEMCGKVRLQSFIENLLQRISLAERLLKYYQSSSSQPNCTAHCMSHTIENGPLRITKSRSAGGLLTSEDPTETREPSDRKGRPFTKSPRESQGHSPDYKPGEGKGQHRQLARYEA